MEQLNINRIKEKITPIFDTYGIKNAFLFGSYSRGEQKKGSDIDLLVEIQKPMGIYDFIELKFILEKKLKKKVDLVSKEAVNKNIKPYIEGDLISIYEKRSKRLSA